MSNKSRRPELIFEDALDAFLQTEGRSLLSDVSERNTCGRLAICLEAQLRRDGLEGYYADVEFNRKQEGEVKTILNEREEVVRITPDLIVHSRGEKPAGQDNLIAIEMKKASRPEPEKESDRVRLRAMTRTPNIDVFGWNGSHPEHVCGYAVGIFIVIDLSTRELQLEFFKKGVRTKQKSRDF